MAGNQPARSVKEIEADLAATRSRMARSVDELAYRVSPETLKAQAVAMLQGKADELKGKANDAVFDESGEVRLDRVATALGGVAGVSLTLGLLRRAFYRG